MDKASETSENGSQLLEFVAQVKEGESKVTFSSSGRRMVEESAESLKARPVSWLLKAVQLANLWGAESLRIRCFKSAVQIELRGVGDRGQCFESLLPSLREGRRTEASDEQLLLDMLWAGLSNPQSYWTLAASAKSGEPTRAAKLDLEEIQWGEASLQPETLFLQLTFQREDGSEFQERALRELYLFSCSDLVPVSCEQELGSFFPLSVRASEDGDVETELELGLWARTSPSGQGVPLGRSFAQLKADGVKRRELSSGLFRVGLLGGKPAQESLRARSVTAFSFHGSPVPSRIVWLQHGVEMAHQVLNLEAQNLAVTVYKELPEGWGAAELPSSLEELRDDLQASLEAMVGEYNRYTPSLDGATLGCWTFLVLACLAGGGLAAPFLGSHLAAPLSALLALLLVRAEYQFRFKKRYQVGQGLKALAEELEDRKDKPLWAEELLDPEERPYKGI